MPNSTADRAPGTSPGRNRNSGTMASFILPITEVLVVADCWQAEPDAEAVIQRAIAAAAQSVDTLSEVEGVRFVRLTSKDVVRHDLVTRIVDAYDARDKKSKS